MPRSADLLLLLFYFFLVVNFLLIFDHPKASVYMACMLTLSFLRAPGYTGRRVLFEGAKRESVRLLVCPSVHPSVSQNGLIYSKQRSACSTAANLLPVTFFTSKGQRSTKAKMPKLLLFTQLCRIWSDHIKQRP